MSGHSHFKTIKAQKEVAQGKYVTLEQIEEDYKKRLAKNAR